MEGHDQFDKLVDQEPGHDRGWRHRLSHMWSRVAEWASSGAVNTRACGSLLTVSRCWPIISATNPGTWIIRRRWVFGGPKKLSWTLGDWIVRATFVDVPPPVTPP